jgi:hypothetical protein
MRGACYICRNWVLKWYTRTILRVAGSRVGSVIRPMKRGLSDLAPDPVPGLRTLLERADLLSRHSEATRICADIGVKKLEDLQYEGVRRELSSSLRLNFVETAKLGAQCADEAKLRSLQEEGRDQRRRLLIVSPTHASLTPADAGSAGTHCIRLSVPLPRLEGCARAQTHTHAHGVAHGS